MRFIKSFFLFVMAIALTAGGAGAARWKIDDEDESGDPSREYIEWVEYNYDDYDRHEFSIKMGGGPGDSDYAQEYGIFLDTVSGYGATSDELPADLSPSDIDTNEIDAYFSAVYGSEGFRDFAWFKWENGSFSYDPLEGSSSKYEDHELIWMLEQGININGQHIVPTDSPFVTFAGASYGCDQTFDTTTAMATPEPATSALALAAFGACAGFLWLRKRKGEEGEEA